MSKAKTYFFAASLSLILVLLVFRIFKIDPSLPLNYTGDAIVHYNFAKNIEATGWWVSNPNLGAPTGQTLHDFPLTETAHLLIIKFLIMLGLNWYESVNTFFILSFPLVTLFSVFVMKRLGLTTQVAIPLSLVYTFLPYHFLRGVNHLFLAAYYVVPLAVYAAYLSASKVELKWQTIILFALLIASSGAYYTFLSLFFIILGGLFAISKGWDKKLLLNLAKLPIVTLFFFFLNYLPALIYAQKYGPNLNATVRLARDTEEYGLKIAQLVLPFEDHNLDILNKIQKRYMSFGSSITNENQYAALGMTAALGFIFLLFWIAFKPNLFKSDKETGAKLDLLGLLNLASILFGTVGGFAVIVSTYINPTFRSMNRVSVFIAFVSLVAVGLILERVKSQKISALVAWLILPIALYDQISLGVMQNFTKSPEEYRSLVKYVDNIEKITGDNAKIYTLPLGQYPEGVDKKMMRLALLTDGIKWSTGAEKWRAANYWQHKVNQLEPKLFLKEIIEEGFTGLLINAEELDATTLANIERELAQIPLQDSKKEYDYYNLRLYSAFNNIPYNPTYVFYYISGNCLYDQTSAFYCIKSGRVEFENTSDITLTKTLEISLEFPGGVVEKINEKVTIPAGKSHYLISRKATKNVFPIPLNVPVWPVNIGYPTFVIKEISLQ